MKTKNFYKENKFYYLIPNEFGDVVGRSMKENNPKCKEAKRVSYYSTDEKKANYRKYIDRITLDADEGVNNAIGVIKPILTKLNAEYWLISGTDKANKPKDSGNIIILFNPVLFDEVKNIKNKKGQVLKHGKFAILLRCLNLCNKHLDPLHTGYMHKNPIWVHVEQFEKYGDTVVDFDVLYNETLSYFNLTEEEIIKQYDILLKAEYTKKVLDELEKEIPNPNKITQCFIKSDKNKELEVKVNDFLSDINKTKQYEQSKKTYAYCNLIRENFLTDPIFFPIIPLKDKYNIDEKEAQYWYTNAKKNFDVFTLNPFSLMSLGFDAWEIERIVEVKNLMLEKGQETKKTNRDEAIERFKFLNILKNSQGLTDNEEVEKWNLYQKITNKKNAKIYSGIWREQNISFSIYIEYIFSYLSENREKFMQCKKAKEYLNKKYQDENNNIYTGAFIAENFFYWNVYNFSLQIEKFGLIQMKNIYDKNRNIIKDITKAEMEKEVLYAVNKHKRKMKKEKKENDKQQKKILKNRETTERINQMKIKQQQVNNYPSHLSTPIQRNENLHKNFIAGNHYPIYKYWKNTYYKDINFNGIDILNYKKWCDNYINNNDAYVADGYVIFYSYETEEQKRKRKFTEELNAISDEDDKEIAAWEKAHPNMNYWNSSHFGDKYTKDAQGNLYYYNQYTPLYPPSNEM